MLVNTKDYSLVEMWDDCLAATMVVVMAVPWVPLWVGKWVEYSVGSLDLKLEGKMVD